MPKNPTIIIAMSRPNSAQRLIFTTANTMNSTARMTKMIDAMAKLLESSPPLLIEIRTGMHRYDIN